MNRIVISLLMVICTLTVSAQDKTKTKKFNPQKFEQKLEAFILQRMNLTLSQKTKFIPLYREMRKKEVAAIMAEGDMSRKKGSHNDKDCAERIKKHDACQVATKKIQQEYHLKMLKVIPASKLMDMIRAEQDFHRDAFRRFHGMKPDGKQGGPVGKPRPEGRPGPGGPGGKPGPDGHGGPGGPGEPDGPHGPHDPHAPHPADMI